MTIQELLSKLSTAMASGSLEDATRTIEQYIKERNGCTCSADKQIDRKSKYCKLIVNARGRVTLATPDGAELPAVVMDSIEVFQDDALLNVGLKRVKLEVYIIDEEMRELKRAVKYRGREVF